MAARKCSRSSQGNNALAATIILNEPDRYVGLQRLWAELWVSKNEPARKPSEQAKGPSHAELVAKRR